MWLQASDKAPGHTGSGCGHKWGKDCSFSASTVVEDGRCPEFTGRGRWGVVESNVGGGGATDEGSCNLKCDCDRGPVCQNDCCHQENG